MLTSERPDLANLVKHIEVDHTTAFALPINLVGDLSGIAANRNLNLLPGWSDDSHRGALAFMELLLLQTPNVETLHLLVDETRTTFSDLAVSEGFSLPALTTLTAAAHPRVPSDWEEPFHFRSGFLLRFLCGSPQITHLGLHRAQNLLPFHVAIGEHEALLAVAPFASITSLTLSHSRHMSFDRVIEACDRLEIFKMTFGNKFHPLYRCFHDVLRGLQKHKLSLHTFVFAGGIYLNVPEVDERPTFREFTSLHSILIVPYISYLTGAFESIVDFLPSSVRRLRLLDVEGADAREGLWGLHAALRRGEFQHLEELVVNPGTPRDDPIGRDQEYGWDDPGVAMAALGMAFWELEGLLFLLRDVDGTVDGLVDAEAVSGRCLGT